MAKLDIGWLDVFIEVYKTQSVSRAAEQLGIAQPNASIALRKLRRHFGDPLFARTSRGMEPTPYARGIYPELSASVERLAHLAGARPTFDAATWEPFLRHIQGFAFADARTLLDEALASLPAS